MAGPTTEIGLESGALLPDPLFMSLPPVSFVPTPIGNLGDITRRAVEVLQHVDLIACEDTRHSRKLLRHLDIEKPLVSLHDHNERRRTPGLLAKAKAGAAIAVISDAGTPCLSDPGYLLLRACREAGVPFQVLPGPSAILPALLSSGFPPYPFTFGGFLPYKKGKRSKELRAALDRDHTSVFFESPHRLISTLEILRDLDSNALICITSELTKKFEKIYSNTAPNLLAIFTDQPPRGELAVVIAPNRSP